MALQKTVNSTLDVPSRFRDYRFGGHVADDASGDNAGKRLMAALEKPEGNFFPAAIMHCVVPFMLAVKNASSKDPRAERPALPAGEAAATDTPESA